MANRRASIWKYVKTDTGWRYCRPVVGRNNKIKPNWVRVNGHQEHHPEGSYHIHYLKNGKQCWEKAGGPAAAVRLAEFQESYFKAVNLGVPVQEKPEDPPLMVSQKLRGYLEEYRLSHRGESYALMKQTLNEFFGYEKADGSWVRGFSSGNLISQITRLDLLKYREWLINKGRSERTAGNKMLRINQYLRAVQDLKPGEGLVTVKDAKYVEVEPEVYNDDELKKFFKACTQFQFAVFKCLLMAGLRKAELESLTWADIDFGAGTIKVSAKPGFSPKTWEERTIEVPAKLLAILKKLPRKSQWVYGIFRIDSPTSQEPSTKSTHQDSKKMGIFQLDDVQSLRSVTSTKANAWDRPDLHKVGRDIYDSLRSSGRRGYKNRARRRYVELKQDKLYTPSEVASLLNVPYDTAVRRMQRMKGCVDMGTQTKRYKRGKKMLRISGKNLMAFLRGKTNE